MISCPHCDRAYDGWKRRDRLTRHVEAYLRSGVCSAAIPSMKVLRDNALPDPLFCKSCNARFAGENRTKSLTAHHKHGCAKPKAGWTTPDTGRICHCGADFSERKHTSSVEYKKHVLDCPVATRQRKDAAAAPVRPVRAPQRKFTDFCCECGFTSPARRAASSSLRTMSRNAPQRRHGARQSALIEIPATTSAQGTLAHMTQPPTVPAAGAAT